MCIYFSNAAWEAQYVLHNPHTTFSETTVRLMQYIVDIGDPDNSVEYKTLFECVSRPQKLVQLLYWTPGVARITGPTGETLLHIACRFHSIKAAEILIYHGLDINAQEHRQLTPLHTALIWGALDCAHMLIDHGCDYSLPDYQGRIPLDFAVVWPFSSATNLVRRLLNRPAPGLHYCGDIRLHCLNLTHLEEDIVRDRLDVLLGAGRGSSMESWDRTGNTPLLNAIWRESARLVNLLTEAGARFDATDASGRNALHVASQKLNLRVIQVLLETKIDSIDIRTRDCFGNTPLYGIRCCINLYIQYPEVYRRPGSEKTRAFETLLRDVRDRTMKNELDNLHGIITMIKEGKTSKAREVIGHLVQEKKKAKIECEAETFRIIGLQIKQSMFEPAIESLEEFMEVSEARVHTSPFDELDVDHSLLRLYLKWVENGLEGESTWTSYFSRFPKLCLFYSIEDYNPVISP